jgi:hypothetical protein
MSDNEVVINWLYCCIAPSRSFKQKVNVMTDLIFVAGQALSIGGLAYGWYLVLTHCDGAGAARAGADKLALLHHLAMA